MMERTQGLDGNTKIGDLLVKIRGRHYLVPAEAIGAPLEDDGTEVLGMLEKELTALGAARESRLIGVDFAMELGEADDRNARALTAQQCGYPTEPEQSGPRQSRAISMSNRTSRAIRP